LVYKTGKIGIYKRYIPLFIRDVEAYKGNKDIKKKKSAIFLWITRTIFFALSQALTLTLTSHLKSEKNKSEKIKSKAYFYKCQ
jgi:hypothetical protein